MSVVGRAYVNVRAVTRQVEPDIQRGVDSAIDRVSAKANSESGSGRKLGDALGDGISKSKLGEKVIGEVDRTAKSNEMDRAGRDLGTSIGNGINREGAISRALKTAFDKVRPEVDKDGEESGKSWVGGFARGAARLGINPMVWIGAAVPAAIEQGLTLVSTAAAGAIGIIQTLGPTTAIAAATGATAIGGLVTAMLTLKLAFKTKSRELSEFKAEMGPLRDEFHGLGITIQRDLFPVLAVTATKVNDALGDNIRRGIYKTTGVVGGLVERFGNLASSPFFQSNISRIMNSNAEALDKFGRSGIFGIGTVTSILASAGPSVERVAGAIRKSMEGIFDNVRIAEGTGRLQKFFTDATNTAFQWAHILGNVGGALVNIISQGSSLGGGLLDSLENVTKKFRDWADSAKGKNSISEWFAQATPVFKSVGGLLGSLGRTFAALSGDVGNLTGTLDAITGALPHLGGVIHELTGGTSGLIKAVAPLIGSLADKLAPAIGDAAASISDHLGPALENLAGPLGDALNNAIKLVDNLTPLITVAGVLLTPVLKIAATALQGINTALDQLPGPISTVILSVIGLRVAWKIAANSIANNTDGMLAKVTAKYAVLKAENVAMGGSFARLRAASSVAMGAIGGGITLALGAAAVAYGIFAQHSEEVKAKVDALADSLNKQTGALTKSTEQLVRQDLEQSGAYKAADQLGLSLDVVTEAALGNKDAMEQVDAATRSALAQYSKTKALVGEPVNTVVPQQLDPAFIAAQANAARDLNGALGQQSSNLDSAASKADRMRRALGPVPGITTKAADAAGLYARKNGALASSADAAERSLSAVKRATLLVNDAAIKGIQGQIGFRQAISDARKDFVKTKDTLSLYTQAGRDNTNSLIGIATAAENVTGSTEKQQAAMKEARRTILELAKAKTDDDDKAKKLTDRIIGLSKEYGKVPKKVKTDVTSPTLTQQIESAKTLRSILEQIDGSVYNYTVGSGGASLPDLPGVPKWLANGGAAAPGPVHSSLPSGRTVAPDGQKSGGVNFNGNINIAPSDYRDFLRQLQNKTRSAQLAGYGGSGNNL